MEGIQGDVQECLSNAVLEHQCLELFRVLGTTAAVQDEGANVWALGGNGGSYHWERGFVMSRDGLLM